MALINWSSTYSVKINEIDNQHRKLVDMINLLHDSMKEGKGKELLDKIFIMLANYTVYHFGYEENLFHKYNYPDMDEHIKEHDDLKSQVVELQKKQKEGNVLTIEVMEFLRKWLLEHMQGSDKKYSQFLLNQGIN